jgi:hypothetical protein
LLLKLEKDEKMLGECAPHLLRQILQESYVLLLLLLLLTTMTVEEYYPKQEEE